MKAINVANETDLKQLVQVVGGDGATKYVSYDIETQADGPKGNNLLDYLPSSRIVSAAFTVGYSPDKPSSCWVLPLAHPVAPWDDWKDALTRVCEAMGRAKLIGSNLKYDVRWTHSMTGVALEDRIWFDTAFAAHALDENEPKGLKHLAVEILGVPPWSEVDLSRADAQPWKQLARYNALDTVYAYRLVEPLKAMLQEDKRLARVYHYILRPIDQKAVKVERNGLKPDPEQIVKRLESSNERINVAERDLLAYAEKFLGEFDEEDVNWHPSSNFFRAFMNKSGAPVYEHTDKGRPSWNKDVLNRLAAEGVTYIEHLLDFREADRHRSFLESWREYAQFDGRIHPTYNPIRFTDINGVEKGTVTGRLSSSNPNAQQIPRKLKSVFTAEDGWLFVEADQAQIEMRVAAWVYNEPNMRAAFQRGDDLHTLFAADLVGKDPEDVTPEERQHAKAGDFGFLYKMGAAGFQNYAFSRYGLELTLEECQDIRQTFLGKWNKIEEGWDRIIQLARMKGYVVSPLGRMRRVPDIHSSNPYLVGRAERQAINSVVQSTASDLTLLAIIDLTDQMDPEECRIVGTVHDSILLEVRRDVAKKNLTRIADVMLYPDIKRRFGATLEVPLAVEFKIGRRWADAKAKTIEVGGRG